MDEQNHFTTLTPDTRVHDLVQHYPYLVDFLADLNKAFKSLKNPVMRQTVGRVATLRRAAAMGSMGVEDLITAIADQIHKQSGVKVKVDRGEALDERDERLDRLKALILQLHTGDLEMEQAKERFEKEFGSIPASEIAIMEQQLIQEGLPAEMITELCDVHVGVMGGGATGANLAEQTPGHPVYTFVAENIALRRIAGQMRVMLSNFDDADEAKQEKVLSELEGQLQLLGSVDKHYLRKENLLFPILERYGFTGPSQVMWSIHDEIRDQLKDMRRAVADRDIDKLKIQLPDLLDAVDDMVTKEESILLPTSIDMLNHEDWAEIYKGEEEIGFTLVERGDDWSPRIKFQQSSQTGKAEPPIDPKRIEEAGIAAKAKPESRDEDGGRNGLIRVQEGELTRKQLDRILLTLPVELSFVDEDDEVRYFTGVQDKIFPRAAAVIGRKVQNCHPPKSLHLVNQILEEMKAGTRETAQFWMDDFAGKFVFIRYDAVRDEDGTYLGCLEAVQDVTNIRALHGSKRLLDEQ